MLFFKKNRKKKEHTRCFLGSIWTIHFGKDLSRFEIWSLEIISGLVLAHYLLLKNFMKIAKRII